MHGRRSKDAALLGVLKKRPIIDGGVDGGCVAGRHGGEGNKKRKKSYVCMYKWVCTVQDNVRHPSRPTTGVYSMSVTKVSPSNGGCGGAGLSMLSFTPSA